MLMVSSSMSPLFVRSRQLKQGAPCLFLTILTLFQHQHQMMVRVSSMVPLQLWSQNYQNKGLHDFWSGDTTGACDCALLASALASHGAIINATTVFITLTWSIWGTTRETTYIHRYGFLPHIYVHAYIHLQCIHTYSHLYIYACLPTYIHTCILSYVHIYMFIPVYLHKYGCQYIHIYILQAYLPTYNTYAGI